MYWYLTLCIVPLLLGLWAQWRVKSAFHAGSAVGAASGLTGAETAKMILDAHGIRNVGIEPSHGFLSDHYDPKSKMLRLSRDVYGGRSVAALGIAAHEAGHALQDATHYGPLKIRNGIVPLAAIGSNTGMGLMFFGVLLASAAPLIGKGMLFAGIALFSLVVLFQLVNLPVEFDASKRAKVLLQTTGVVQQGREAGFMDRVLNAAALTYVAATVASIGTLLYYILILTGGNRSED